jgi:hypothetical protein
MDWLNSAGMMITAWKTAFPVPSLPPGPEGLETSGTTTSFGFRIAQRLLEEVGVAYARNRTANLLA